MYNNFLKNENLRKLYNKKVKPVQKRTEFMTNGKRTSQHSTCLHINLLYGLVNL